MQDKICVKNLQISFGKKLIIKDLSFTVGKSQSLCIVGASGSGKSVLVKSIIGLVKKSSGSIKINGTEILPDTAQNTKEHDIAMSFQSDGLFDSMNIMGNLCFALLKKKNVKSLQAQQMAQQMIEKVRLSKDVLKLYPQELSGGMKKRIAVARAIITTPEIIFFDEPTTGLDPITSYKIIEMINSYIKKKNVTSIVITHNMFCAKSLADKIAVMQHGDLVWHDDANKIDSCKNTYVKDFLKYS